MEITFILGAGFSLPAGFPSGQSLSQKFFLNTERKLLKFSSGEWAWDEYTSVESHNGRLNRDHLNISYLLSELVSIFQNETSLPFDYESFYDWINRDFSQELINIACEKANERLLKENVHQTYLFNKPDINEYIRIQDAYVYLIADLLNRPYKQEDRLEYYTPFIIELLKGSLVNIFSLNHDLLTEYVLYKNNIEYADGFTTLNSEIENEKGYPIPVFKNLFDKPVNLHKLHGSVNYYLFTEMEQSGGLNIYRRTNNYWFFKTSNYHDIHTASRVDLSANKVLQAINPDIKPQFLTGKSKLALIENHNVYKHLYSRLKGSLHSTNRLIIIGYSYQDIHINHLILDMLSKNSCEIINVNPTTLFPFRREYKYENIFNLRNIQDFQSVFR